MTAGSANSLGIYISIPFCRSKCTYCNFASGVYPVTDHERYAERVIDDVAGAAAWAAAMGVALPRQVDTVYLGGGTPSLLAPGLLAKLFEAVRSHFDVERDAEITVESAPGQLPDQTLQALVEVGVNRVSLGVQSFIDAEAHASGRLHNHAVVSTDIARLRSAGIANLNIDLIAGLPGQTLGSWQESLAALIDANVPHASIYMLEVDEDSRLGRELLQGGRRYRAGLVPGDDAIARMYESAIERLDAAGLRQYEISNFARPGSLSRHNLRYWQRRPYLGIGLDASSALRAAEPPGRSSRPGTLLRATTTSDLREYLAGPSIAESTWLSPEQEHEEAWFLGLRLNAGVDVAALEQEFGRAMVSPALETAHRLVGDGLLTLDGARIRLTARGQLIANEIFEQFLAPDPAGEPADVPA
jgi:oxygen-independent coproporphyrinogen III oxidase